MSVRTLNWFESEFDATNISNNRWNLQIAKAVASGSGTPTYSMVWKSRALAPITSISWKAEYALAWTATVPTQGAAVRIIGKWQPCNKGESFDINKLGFWQPSAKPAEASNAGWLNVGNIDYAYPNVLGIHIVVGVRNADSNQFEAVFVDKATLGPGSSARYQPQETVSWWLEGSDLTGQVFSTQKGHSATQDFTNPSDPLTGAFEWSTSFMTVSSQWVITPGAAPQSFTAPPPSAQFAAMSLGGNAPLVLQLGGASWIVKLAVPLGTAALGAAGAGLLNRLKDKLPLQKVDVHIEGSGGFMFRVTFNAGGNDGAPGTVASLGAPQGASGGLVAAIEEALREIQSSGDLPMSESWQIFPSTKPDNLAIEAPMNRPYGLAVMPDHPQQSAEPSFSGSNADFRQSQQGQQNPVGNSSFNQAYSNGISA